MGFDFTTQATLHHSKHWLKARDSGGNWPGNRVDITVAWNGSLDAASSSMAADAPKVGDYLAENVSTTNITSISGGLFEAPYGIQSVYPTVLDGPRVNQYYELQNRPGYARLELIQC